jgi:hypothetical protein
VIRTWHQKCWCAKFRCKAETLLFDPTQYWTVSVIEYGMKLRRPNSSSWWFPFRSRLTSSSRATHVDSAHKTDFTSIFTRRPCMAQRNSSRTVSSEWLNWFLACNIKQIKTWRIRFVAPCKSYSEWNRTAIIASEDRSTMTHRRSRGYLPVFLQAN